MNLEDGYFSGLKIIVGLVALGPVLYKGFQNNFYKIT